MFGRYESKVLFLADCPFANIGAPCFYLITWNMLTLPCVRAKAELTSSPYDPAGGPKKMIISQDEGAVLLVLASY